MSRLVSALLAGALLSAAGCARDGPAPGGVVATLLPVEMMARELVGQDASVHTLVPPGASPHTFEPRPADMARLAGAGLVVRVGGGLDDWVLGLLASAPEASAELALLEVPGLELLPGGGGDATPDPHVWLDPLRVRDALAPALADALADLAPPHAAAVRGRLADFQARRSALDAEIRRTLAPVPQRSYVPFHDAWRYFAARYDLEKVAVVQAFPGEEPTPRELARLVDAARAAGVGAVLVEPQLDPRTAAVIAREFSGATVVVDPNGDPADPERASYEALMRFNARAFRRALGGGGP